MPNLSKTVIPVLTRLNHCPTNARLSDGQGKRAIEQESRKQKDCIPT
jgi:hypothetical protein